MPVPSCRIDLNEVPEALAKEPYEPLAVTPKSPLKLRREVERFATYFRREFHYDFQQFEATEKPEKPYAAYLFINKPNYFPRVWAGACCFRWRDFKDAEARWGMQWMWLHPYFRAKGILSGAWDKFHEVHGNFLCEGPFSPAMEAFLRRRGKCLLCWRPLGKSETLSCGRCDEQYKTKGKKRA
jgi:hypothetical protein